MNGVTEETTGAEYAPEAAFATALTGAHALFGEPLAKFSTSRKMAAQAMGCQAPSQFTVAAHATFRRTMQYPGLHNDLVCILWLCTLADTIATAAEFRAGVFTPDRAISRPDEARIKAREWSEKVGLDSMSNEGFEEAWKVFLDVVFGIDASEFQVKEDRGGAPASGDLPPKTEPGHPNSRSSSHGSPGRAVKRQRSSGKK